MGQGVEVIRRSERRQPAQTTPGMLREEAFDSDGTWVGTVLTQPGVETGWHHHGAYASYIYVLSGTGQMHWGPGGAEAAGCEAGDVVRVAPGVIHREITTGTVPWEAVLVRVGSGQVTFNTEGPEGLGDSGE